MVQWLIHNRRGAARVGAVRWWAAAIFFLFLTTVPVTPAGAQAEVSREAVDRELDRTDRVIEKARQLVPEVTAVVAHKHFNAAKEFQRRARKAASPSSATDAALRQAVLFTRRAQQEAIKAIDAARAEKITQENVRRAIERAQDRALEVGEQVRASRHAQARQVFEQGLEQLNGARRANRDRHYAQAQQLADRALSLINRAGRVVQESASDGAAVEASIEKTRALVDQAIEVAREHGQSSPQLTEAQHLLQRANQHLRAGQHQQALQLSAAARQKVLQVLAQFEHEPTVAFVQDSIEEILALMEEIGPKVESEGSDVARRNLAEARKRLRRAQEALNQGNPRQALERLAAARNLLIRAAKSVGLR